MNTCAITTYLISDGKRNIIGNLHVCGSYERHYIPTTEMYIPSRRIPKADTLCCRVCKLGNEQELADQKGGTQLNDRLVGPVVKASASRAEGPGFESRLHRDFFGVES